MSDDKPPQRQPLPRLRVTSHSFADVSHGSIANVTPRTVLSSTSMLSTPSNNIRRVQQRNGFRTRAATAEKRNSDIPAGGNATKKLLNLHQLKKTYANPKPFVLRKPINMSKYDYSVFADHAMKAGDDDELPPPIKELQIRAWESAEKISANIIFESSQDPENSICEDGAADLDLSIDDTQLEDDLETSINRGHSPLKQSKSEGIISSIPGYTKGELKLLTERFRELTAADHLVNPVEFEDSVANSLWVHRQQESAAKERAFMATQSYTSKRQMQVYHKKELLRKLFGYANNVNEDFITNNTSYSAFDNVSNVTKAIHEDKDEMMALAEEHKNFEEMISETRMRFLAPESEELKPPLRQPEINTSHLLDLTLTWLTLNYSREEIESGDTMDHDGEDEQELVSYTLAHFKKLIKENDELQI